MEENKDYYKSALKSLPPELKNDSNLEIVLSEAIEDYYEFFRGVRYKQIPDRSYDFIFVDGPDLMVNPAQKPLTFDYDLVKLVGRSLHPISAFVDTRTSTCFVYSLLFPKKFKYDYLRRFGIIESVTKNDLVDAKKIVSEAMSRRSFNRPNIFKFITGNY